MRYTHLLARRGAKEIYMGNKATLSICLSRLSLFKNLSEYRTVNNLLHVNSKQDINPHKRINMNA